MKDLEPEFRIMQIVLKFFKAEYAEIKMFDGTKVTFRNRDFKQ